MGKEKKRLNQQRQNFLLTFFDKEPKYQTKEVNGFILVKQFNGETGDWQVAIYTPESYKKATYIPKVQRRIIN